MLTVRNVSKQFGPEIRALNDVSLHVSNGEVVALLGPSGCGKTTLLRIIAGLEELDQGSILLDGEDLTRIPVHRRNFGFMFQDFALFPHQTVAQNIEFGLRMRNAPQAERRRRVADMLDLVSLPGYGHRTIFELSGGERQRVALARSLAPNPQLLMLDEPLGSLDRSLRESLAFDLRAILHEVGVTSLYVTHDQEEALVMSDKVAIMQHGRIEQIDPPEKVYRRPATEFVARFLGFRNLIPIAAIDHDGTLHTAIGPVPPADSSGVPNWRAGSELDPAQYKLLIRPESARVVADAAEDAATDTTTDTMTDTMEGAAYSPDAARIRRASARETDSPRRITLRGTLASCLFLGVEYRIAVDIAMKENPVHEPQTGEQPDRTARLTFDIPSNQIDLQSGILTATRLPAIGQGITLYLYPHLMSIIQAGN